MQAQRFTRGALAPSVERLYGGFFVDSLQRSIMRKLARILCGCHNFMGCSGDCPKGLEDNPEFPQFS